MDAERLVRIQAAVAAEGCNAWLFYDFRGNDPVGRRILELGSEFATRRWFYCIPALGKPWKLVSAVEPHVLDRLPGERCEYRTWEQLHSVLRSLLQGVRRVAMQYSPQNAVPYVSRVDAGTVELIRSFGIEVVSSADLVQQFEAVWTLEQYASHRRAACNVRDTVHAAFAEIARRVKRNESCDEARIQKFILDQFRARGLTTQHAPIVAVDAHSADPHYMPPEEGSAPIENGSFVLIDLWAKEPEGMYADITWTGYVGTEVPDEYAKIFEIVRRARDAGVETVRKGSPGGSLRGCDVDARVRAVIEAAGYGQYFVHRTGHSIGTEVHGNGANIDGFETPDDRRLLPGTCFSIEPGIYLPGRFGVRSELNIYLDGAQVVVTGEPVQGAIVPILAMASAESR